MSRVWLRRFNFLEKCTQEGGKRRSESTRATFNERAPAEPLNLVAKQSIGLTSDPPCNIVSRTS